MTMHLEDANVAYVAPKTLARARSLRRKLTDAESQLWSQLRRNFQGLRFRRQHHVGPFIADFACVSAMLVVEVDGSTHATDTERAYDARRDAFMRSRGWQVVRVLNCDVYDSLEGVIDYIVDVGMKRERALNRES
jgi:very-short-patch-repair endonuclease